MKGKGFVSPLIVVALGFGVTVFLAVGLFFGLKLKMTTPPQEISESPLHSRSAEIQTEPEGLKVGYISSESGKESLATINVKSGERSILLVSKGSSIGNLAWSPTKKKIAFDMCCGEGVTGIWIMNPDGSNQKRVHEYKTSIAQLQWSPDGNFLSFLHHTGQTYENFEEIKIIDSFSGAEVSSFNVIDRKAILEGNYFWLPDGNSLIVKVVVVRREDESGRDREVAIESWQISTRGEIIRTFMDKAIVAVENSRFFYTRSVALQNQRAKTLYSSNIEDKDEKVIFSGGEGCEKFSIQSREVMVKSGRLAFLIGGEANPFPKYSPECARSRVAIYDLETKGVVETEPIVYKWAWSPKGQYLAIIRQIPAPMDQPPTPAYSEIFTALDLYSKNGKFLETLITENLLSDRGLRNLIFIYP